MLFVWSSLAVTAALHFALTREIGLGGAIYSLVLVGTFGTAIALTLSSAKKKPEFMLLFASIFLPIYLFEGYLSIAPYLPKFHSGYTAPFDGRSTFDVVMELRSSGGEAYPAVYSQSFLNNPISLDGEPILPLGGIAGVKTVYCSEAGPYLIYDSDEYGFQNPAAIWNGPIQVVLLGDSYTQGACVPPGRHFSGLLREQYPGTINLGLAGSWPLLEYARLKEYALHRRPKLVLWFYYEGNDIIRYLTREGEPDLEIESANAILARYMEGEFRQNIPQRQQSIDKVIIKFVETLIVEELARGKRDGDIGYSPPTPGVQGSFDPSVLFSQTGEFLSIQKTAAYIRNTFTDAKVVREISGKERGRIEKALTLLPMYESILEKAAREIAAGGGRLVMVYLPSESAVLENEKNPLRERIVAIWEEIGLASIDLTRVFRDHENPEALFAGHYSEEGYAMVGRTVIRYLANMMERERRAR